MRIAHGSLADIGNITALGQLPWSCKVLWSPFFDRYGRLDRWLRLAQLLLAALFVLLMVRHDSPTLSTWVGLLPIMVALATASAVQDTVSDAAFVHMSQDATAQEVAKISSWRITAYKLAMMGAGGGAVAVGATWGWPTAFGLLAALLAVSALVLPPYLRAIAPLPPVTLRAWGRALKEWLSRPGAWGTFAFILFYKLGLATLNPMTKPYWVDAGVDPALLGLLVVTVSLGGTVGGALLAGLYGGTRGMMLPLMVGAVAESCACLAYAVVVHLPYHPAFLVLCLLAEGLAQGLATAALMLLLARICDRSQAATQFAALTATFGITRALGSTLGSQVAFHYGYMALFTVLPITCLWSLLWLGSVRRRLAEAARLHAAP